MMDYFKSVKKNMKILYKSDEEIEQCSSFSDKINCDGLRLDSYNDKDSKKLTRDNLGNIDIVYIAVENSEDLQRKTQDNALPIIKHIVENMEIHTILVFTSQTQPVILEDIIPKVDILYCCKIFVNGMIWWLFSKTKYDDIFIRGKKLLFSNNYNIIGIDLPNINFMSEFIYALYGRNNRRWLYFVGLLFFIVFIFFIYWYRKQIIHFLKRLFKMRTDN